MSTTEFVSGAAWFLFYALAAYIAVFVPSRRSPAILIVAVACLSTIASLPVGLVVPIEANYWRALTVFLFLGVCHLMVFGATYKSLSLRILLDMYHAPQGKLPIEALFHGYIEGESFDTRVQVMIDHGLAAEAGEGMTLTPKGKRLARAVQFAQRLYGVDKSG